MRHLLTRYVIVIVTLALGGVVVTLTTANGVRAQGGRPSTPVQIVSPVPVPITGNVGLSGSAEVQVTNTPTVSISGTPAVTIGNAATAPVNVRNVDNPAHQPVEINFDENMDEGAGQTFCPIAVYTVPAGKTLVIEYVNFFGIGPGSPVESLGFSIQGSFVDYVFITEQRGHSQIGSLFYTVNEPTRIYFGPSATVSLCAFRGSVKTGFMTARAKLSGHLVDGL